MANSPLGVASADDAATSATSGTAIASTATIICLRTLARLAKRFFTMYLTSLFVYTSGPATTTLTGATNIRKGRF
jgi:hypothetical protein